MTKKLYRWILGHEKKFYLCTTIILVISDISLIFEHYFQLNNNPVVMIVTRIMVGASATLCVSGWITLFREKKLKDFFISVFDEANKLYFHGFKLSRYLDTDVFLRLEAWIGHGMCYELSALAMILMKGYKSVKLCRGDYYDKAGIFKTKHSWVEVKIPFNGWYVIDFAWLSPAFCKKKEYFRHYNTDGKLLCRWTCSHDDFWNIRFSNIIHKAIQSIETSSILLDLSGYGGPLNNGYGFSDWLFEAEDLRFLCDGIMPPHYRHESDKPLSSRIIRDFVKRPKRKSPKAKSIRTAKLVIRKFKVWEAQQATLQS